MSEKDRKIRRIEVGRIDPKKVSESRTLYIRIYLDDESERPLLPSVARIEFLCANATEFLDNFDSLAGSLAAEITQDTMLIAKELDEEYLAIVAQAWNILQP